MSDIWKLCLKVDEYVCENFFYTVIIMLQIQNYKY